MLNLQKYLNKAEADPGFRQKLLQDANQAIKEKFGDDLPYKVTCREKLVFEVNPTESFSESEFSKVSGGNDSPPKMRILKTVLRRKGKDGRREKVYVYAPGYQPSGQQPTSKNLSSNELSSVAGGVWENNVDYQSPSTPSLESRTRRRRQGHLGARNPGYPRVLPAPLKKQRWGNYYHAGNYDDFLVESNRNFINKHRGGFFG